MDKLRHIGAKVPSDLYDQIQADAAGRGVGLSEVVRVRLTEVYRCESPATESARTPQETAVHPVHAALVTQLGEKDAQLHQKDCQIAELHQLLALKEKNLGQLTTQLDRSQLALEDLRHKSARSWWQRLTGA